MVFEFSQHIIKTAFEGRGAIYYADSRHGFAEEAAEKPTGSGTFAPMGW